MSLLAYNLTNNPIYTLFDNILIGIHKSLNHFSVNIVNGKSFSNMQSLFILAICITAISIIVIVSVRISLKNKSKVLSRRIATITPYKDIQESREKGLKQSNKSFFIDIETDLRNCFNKHIIP